MYQVVDPGTMRSALSFFDDIVFSRTRDLQDNEVNLTLSLLSAFGPAEMAMALGNTAAGQAVSKRPAIVCLPGGGWRGIDKNSQIGELVYLARAGYTVACAQYRSSAQAHCPAQVIDAKTAIRFLRANAERYSIDPQRIGVMGRSAGGHLTAMLALNDGRYEGEEWAEYSSEVQAAFDMFGPADIVRGLEVEQEKIKNPDYRWQSLADTHYGPFLGGEEETMLERAEAFSPARLVTDTLAPLLIMHGDQDPLLDYHNSSKLLYDAAVKAGHTDTTSFYLLRHAGHGTDAFFQPSIKKIVVEFFDRYLKS